MEGLITELPPGEPVREDVGFESGEPESETVAELGAVKLEGNALLVEDPAFVRLVPRLEIAPAVLLLMVNERPDAMPPTNVDDAELRLLAPKEAPL